jgi:hypothetical protein
VASAAAGKTKVAPLGWARPLKAHQSSRAERNHAGAALGVGELQPRAVKIDLGPPEALNLAFANAGEGEHPVPVGQATAEA